MTISAREVCPWSVTSNPKFDMWSSIQDAKPPASVKVPDSITSPSSPPPQQATASYVHPMMRRSSSCLSQKSLEVCTESLGSETGSDQCFSDFLDDCFSSQSSSSSSSSSLSSSSSWWSSPCRSPTESVMSDVDEEEECDHDVEQQEQQEEEQEEVASAKKELLSVNYHCSLGRRQPTRSFPPPLPSISRRDGPCVRMRSHREDGRLVLQAVPVPSQNYLHCKREGGRLLLTFIEPSFEEVYPAAAPASAEKEQELQEEVEEQVRLLDGQYDDGDVAETGEEAGGHASGVLVRDTNEEGDSDVISGLDEESQGLIEEEAEEEVEVVDRGIVVEVKVSRQPQPLSGGVKVRRSSLVINKFVGGVVDDEDDDKLLPPPSVDTGADVGGTVPAGEKRGEYSEIFQGRQGPPPMHVPQPQRSTTKWSVGAERASTSSTGSGVAEEVEFGWGNGGRHVRPAPSTQDTSTTSTFKNRRQGMIQKAITSCRSDPHRRIFILERCCIATS